MGTGVEVNNSDMVLTGTSDFIGKVHVNKVDLFQYNLLLYLKDMVDLSLVQPYIATVSIKMDSLKESIAIFSTMDFFIKLPLLGPITGTYTVG